MSTLIAQAQDCKVHPDFLKYYGKIIGATIQHVVLVGGEYGEPVPVLIMKAFDGTMLQVEVWSDPEGNGSGHLDIAPYPASDMG